VSAGSYQLQFVQPSGYNGFTAEYQGSDNTVDSDVDQYGYTDVFTVGLNAIVDHIDAGLLPLPGCFIAGTLVAMADGTEKPIEDVVEGDRVLGEGGRINTVKGLYRPILGDRLLYSINGSDYFVTSEHPFAGPDGWKAIDPDATALEIPDLDVSPLVVGDAIVVLKSSEPEASDDDGTVAIAAPPRVATEAAVSIRSRCAPVDTQLYNLMLDGDHTYFADGFLVHNKVL
jgi:hypothetical protein